MSTVREQLFDAIYGQESGHGRADTSEPNEHGVRGPMQIKASTFDGMKAKGIIPANFDHANPEHNLAAGRSLINHLADKYQDDPRKVAAAYYAGEKAVRPDGTIANFRDLKNPKNPDTFKYVDDIMRRMGQPVEQQAAAPRPTVEYPEDVTTAVMPGKTTKLTAAQAKALAAADAQQGITPDQFVVQPAPGAIPAVLAAEQAKNVAEAQKVLDSSFNDKARAAFLDTFTGAIGRHIIDQAVRSEVAPDPAYRLNPQVLEGKSQDEIEELQDSTSRLMEERILWEQEQRRDRHAEAGRGGVGIALLASLYAGLPEGFLTGVAAFRAGQLAGVASGQLASQGRTGAAVMSSLTENAGLNVGMTAIQQAVDGYVGAEDYVMALGMGTVGTALTIPSIHSVALAAQGEKLARDAATSLLQKAEQAARNLGADATPEQIRAEIKRMDEERIATLEADATGALPANRRLIEVDEEGELRAASTAQVESTPAQGRDAIGGDDIDGSSIFIPSGPVENIKIANGGLLNPWNSQSESALRVAATAPANRKVLEGGLGQTLEEWDKLPAGMYYADNVPAKTRETLDWLHKNFLPDVKIKVSMGLNGANLGEAMRVPGGGAISLRDGADAHTIVHEFGHLLVTQRIGKVKPELAAAMREFHKDWLQRYTGAAGPVRPVPEGMPDRAGAVMERSLPSEAPGLAGTWLKRQGFSMFDWLARNVDRDTGRPLQNISDATLDARQKAKDYWPNFDEMSAEQFVKYIEATLRKENDWKPVSIPKELADFFRKLWSDFTSLFQKAKAAGYLNADESFVDFFEAVRKDAKRQGTLQRRAAEGKDPYGGDDSRRKAAAVPAGEATEVPFDPKDFGMARAEGTASMSAGDPVAAKYGLDLLPEATPAQRAEKQAIIALYRKADDPAAAWNNIDPKFIDSITDNQVFNVASSSLRMLKSENPVVRMVASELLESPSGATGRRSTAALSKFMHERKFMGNAINDVQAAYKVWRQENGGNFAKDFIDGQHWERFNREVAAYIESQGNGSATGAVHPAVAQAANVLRDGYERMRVSQRTTKTAGWASLPETSLGYMPHRMSPEKVRNMTTQQAQALHSALVDQFIQIEGWDISFSANLASKYIERVRARALGEFESTVGIHQTGAAEIVEDALNAMGMAQDEVKAAMQKYMRGAPGHTKRRIKLDLNAEQEGGFRLLDLFETDQLKLLRAQAQRVSGEVALARHGVMGTSGLKLLRRAMGYGDAGARANPSEIEAFDQVAAEFLGEPFGEQGGKWLNRAVQFNSLARLGGMGFTQFAEFINGAAHVGITRTLSAMGDMRRLRAEAIALANGEKVDNPLLSSLERFGGAEFGTDSYKLVFPFDNPDLQYQALGKDTVTMADRLLRGASHAQGKLSFWRAIHSAQQRGMAEQVVHKAIRYIREGSDDVALRDMGFTPELQAYMRGELADAAEFDGAGNLVRFDITKVRDQAMAEEFVQAVHRGTAQIIQGTYIGETGKWAHSGFLRLITQFRTFSITSVEKQWARQRANRGTAQALGLLMGAMSFAAPIYMARVALAAQGREDKDEYLEKQLAPAQIARATLNYVAMSGLAGDFLDAFTAVSGVGEVTGGRTGVGSQFVGNVVAPAAGLVDDAWRAVQNTKEGTDPSDLLKSLPFSKLPYLMPAVNSLGN